jgi:hypothetical protein
MKGDRTPRGFEHVGKTVCCGKANRSKKEHGEPEEEEGMEDEAPYSEGNVSGYARRQRGWWKRGVVQTKLNTVFYIHDVENLRDTKRLVLLIGYHWIRVVFHVFQLLVSATMDSVAAAFQETSTTFEDITTKLLREVLCEENARRPHRARAQPKRWRADQDDSCSLV